MVVLERRGHESRMYASTIANMSIWWCKDMLIACWRWYCMLSALMCACIHEYKASGYCSEVGSGL